MTYGGDKAATGGNDAEPDMKCAIVTGAAGFTGRHLCAHLKALGYVVHGLGAAPPSPDLAERFHQANLGDPVALRTVFDEVRPDVVVHLAAVAFVQHSNIDEIYATNVIGTRHLLQAIVESDAEPSVVALASSANVYGNIRSGKHAEHEPINPANDYAASKASMELVAQLYSDKLPLIVTRPFNYTGAGQSTQFVIAKIVDHAKRRAGYIELGNIEVARDFSDVRDIVTYYGRLLETPAAIGQTINLCSGRSHSLRQMISMVEDLSKHRLEIRVDPKLVRENEIPSMCGDPDALHRLIGASPSIPMHDTLAWMLDN